MPLCCTGQELHGEFSWLFLGFFPRGTLLHVYRCTKCHGSPWSGVQSGGHLEVWDVPVAKPKCGALCPGADVKNDADWLTSSSPTLGPSVELDQGKPGATRCGSAFLQQSSESTLPGDNQFVCYGTCWCYVAWEICSRKLKEDFMGGLSFLNKVSLDSCPEGGTFSQGVYPQFLSIPCSWLHLL